MGFSLVFALMARHPSTPYLDPKVILKVLVLLCPYFFHLGYKFQHGVAGVIAGSKS